jgi:hypothetical protein
MTDDHTLLLRTWNRDKRRPLQGLETFHMDDFREQSGLGES